MVRHVDQCCRLSLPFAGVQRVLALAGASALYPSQPWALAASSSAQSSFPQTYYYLSPLRLYLELLA